MKPLLIFHFPDNFTETEKHITVEAINAGLDYGSLILDSRVCVLSFDKNGDMNYCTPKYAIKTD